MATRIQLRGDTLANWTASNPVLADREMVLETDTKRYKIGDGITAYLSLDYSSLPTDVYTESEVDNKMNTLSSSGYLYLGIATTSTVPLTYGVNDRKYYLFNAVVGSNVLTNFSISFTETENSIYSIKWNGTEWITDKLDGASKTYVENLINNDLSNLGLSLTSNRKYLAVFIDTSNKVLFGVDRDGKFVCDNDAMRILFEKLSIEVENKVSLFGDESIGGIKTFESSPIAPTPTTNNQVANKAYADSAVLNVTGINFITNRKYLAAFVDLAGRVLLGIDKNGNTVFTNDYITSLKENIDLNVLGQLKFTSNRKYLAVFIDTSNKVLFGVDRDGKFVCDIQKISDILSSISDHETRLDNIENNLSLTKEVVCIGDSLTYAGTYEDELQSLLGSDFNVINVGVGGESASTICARVGATGMYIQDAFTLPADADTYVNVASRTGKLLLSGYNNEECLPLLFSDGGINPVMIDGIECTLSAYSPSGQSPLYYATDTVYRLKRLVAGSERNFPAKTFLYTYASRTYRNQHSYILFMGQNLGYTSPEDLSYKYDRIIAFMNAKNVIIVGLHTLKAADRLELETYFENKYGLQYLNLRKYMANHGLGDAGLTANTNNETGYGAGTYESDRLTLTSGIVVSGTQKITLGGTEFDIVVTTSYSTPALLCTYLSTQTFTGWSPIYTSGNTYIDFVSINTGVKSAPIFNANSTGAVGTFTVNTAGQYNDTQCMSLGMTPLQLLKDTVHFTVAGYTLLGKKLYELFNELNYK